jgi:hypothetical protein
MTLAHRAICRATFSNVRPSRDFIQAAASVLVLMLGLTGMPDSAFAVSSSNLDSISLSDSSWSVNLGSMLTYDPTTGTYLTPNQSTSNGLPPPTGWHWDNNIQTLSSTGSLQTVSGVQQTESDGSVITFYATGNPDPFLSYGFGVSNPTGSARTFLFVDGGSVAPPISGNYNLFADIGGSITDAGGHSGSAQVTPIASTIQSVLLSTDGGATFFDSGADIGPVGTSTGVPTPTASYGIYSTSLSGFSGTPINYWLIADKFTLTPDGDSAALTGFAELTSEIPEPSTYAVLIGVLSLGVVVLRRNKRQQH